MHCRLKVWFFRKWMYDSHIFCAEKWSTSNIEHLNLWYQFDHWKLQFDKDFPERKLFWLFIPETSSRTAVFLGLTFSASTCQWYPGCLVTWEIILLVITRLLPWQSKSKKHQKTFYIQFLNPIDTCWRQLSNHWLLSASEALACTSHWLLLLQPALEPANFYNRGGDWWGVYYQLFDTWVAIVEILKLKDLKRCFIQNWPCPREVHACLQEVR